ncbi:MAG TPA: hypothetical protein DD979_18385 [Gammaproteobacteria bacterium]|nr:hypothetical protein [Gammaproteobacteria bacterium]
MFSENLWQWVGVALVVWLAWDLYQGSTWIHRAVFRRQEPVLYWVLMAVWAMIAVMLLFNTG